MCSLVDQGGMFFTDIEKVKFRDCTQAFLLHASWLCTEAQGAGKFTWHIVPKHHYVAHMPDQAALVNPRFTWCYGSESMVGRISRLGQSCLAGTPAYLVSQSLMQKYVVAMHLQLEVCS